MQRLVVLVVLALGIVPVAHAQPTPPAGEPIEQPRTLDSLTAKEIEREQQQQRWQGPSGFWTSPHKSEHGAYRYRMMLIGLGLLAITGFVTWRLLRRASAERATRSAR